MDKEQRQLPQSYHIYLMRESSAFKCYLIPNRYTYYKTAATCCQFRPDIRRKETDMSQLSDTGRIRTTTGKTSALRVFVLDERTLRRITGLIQLGFGVLNGLVGLRFMLKLMAANPANPFASLVYFITTPFLWMFQNITSTPSFNGIVIEFFSLIAIVVYSLIGWIIIQLMWILFARMK